jgi:hypothetical protein
MNESVLRATIPVVINAYEQVTFLATMIHQIRDAGFRNLIIVDQNSKLESLVEYLRKGSADRLFTLFELDENVGPRWFFTSDLYQSMPELFFYTDPDLAWPNGIAEDMASRFISLSEKYKQSKVGSALTLPHEDIGLGVTIGEIKIPIKEWEKQFWKNELEPSVYGSAIDTTWHLVNKKYFTPHNFLTGLRVAGRGYECLHLPWYSEARDSAPEFNRYQTVSKWSHY